MIPECLIVFSLHLPFICIIKTRYAINHDGNGSNAGHVRVYDFNGTSWIQRGLDIEGKAANEQTGFSVSLSSASDHGTMIAIGAPYSDGNRNNDGHVRVYEFVC